VGNSIPRSTESPTALADSVADSLASDDIGDDFDCLVGADFDDWSDIQDDVDDGVIPSVSAPIERHSVSAPIEWPSVSAPIERRSVSAPIEWPSVSTPATERPSVSTSAERPVARYAHYIFSLFDNPWLLVIL